MTTNNHHSLATERPVWLITGCSTGFGRELAKQALGSGYRTVVRARRPAEVSGLAALGDALVLALDVTDRAQIDAAVAYSRSTCSG